LGGALGESCGEETSINDRRRPGTGHCCEGEGGLQGRWTSGEKDIVWLSDLEGNGPYQIGAVPRVRAWIAEWCPNENRAKSLLCGREIESERRCGALSLSKKRKNGAKKCKEPGRRGYAVEEPAFEKATTSRIKERS